METKQVNSKKGEEGEQWIDDAVALFGWKIIKFDWWQASADRLFYKEGKSILAQIKNKEPRKSYPDTGLEKYRFEKLKEMCRETGIKGMILFTDKTCNVYGDFTDNLKNEIHGGEYNSKNNTQMIYFWIKDLKTLKELLWNM